MSRRHIWFTFCVFILALGVIPAFSGGETEPANPNDLQINRAFRQKIKTKGGDDRNNNGIVEPMLSSLLGRELRIAHTKQVQDGKLMNLLAEQRLEAIGVGRLGFTTGERG